jgi:hypothetical protein
MIRKPKGANAGNVWMSMPLAWPDQYQLMTWPSQDEPREVYVHVVRTRVRKLYTCQLVIARYALDCPLKAVRYWASSDLEADASTLVHHITTRWDIVGGVQCVVSDLVGSLRLVYNPLETLDREASRHNDASR